LGRIRWDGVVRNVEYLGLFEEESGIGIRKWLAGWRERQRRASVAQMGHQSAHVHHAAHVNSYVPSGSSIDPILIEESSEGSTSEGNTDSEMAYSDDMDDYMDDEDEEDEQQTHGWDPLSLAIAGMKMADPFALDLNGYARQRVAPGTNVPMESVDPLHG